MSPTKRVTIIIVTHNGRHYLPECLASVFDQHYLQSLLKIIVIDNDSSDSTVSYLRQWPQVKVVVNRKNLGFAVANNQGYYLAKKQEADYLFLLNQDTVLEKNCLQRLVTLAEKNHKIAAVQPKILLHPEKHLINSLGNCINFLGFAYCDKYRAKDSQPLVDPFEVTYASGAACLLRMSALEQTDLFDPRLFMYHDDVDLGWRLRLAGYRIMVDPLAVVYHKYTFGKGKYKFYYLERNRLLVLLQNYRLLTLVIFLPPLVLMEAGMLLFALKNGWLKEKIKGYFWLLSHWPSILSQRLRVHFQIRKVSDREVLRFFSGAIKSEELKNPLLVYLVNPLLSLYFWLAKKIIFW
ncbi:MAG: glycosyltransferase family 2 protein [Patescibacteria group bacterium]